MALMREYGEMWARNAKNIKSLPGSKKGGQGVYILYDGSMPVYIGRGNIRQRIREAKRSKRRGRLWDHFSWYIPSDPELTHDIEALLLRMLPFYLRALNRQRGTLEGAERKKQIDRSPKLSSRTKLPRK